MQLEDRFSGVIFHTILYYLQGNIMSIASHLVGKNSIVVFGYSSRHANIDKNQISDLGNKRKQKQKMFEN
jgi:hypothetical protein